MELKKLQKAQDWKTHLIFSRVGWAVNNCSRGGNAGELPASPAEGAGESVLLSYPIGWALGGVSLGSPAHPSLTVMDSLARSHPRVESFLKSVVGSPSEVNRSLFPNPWESHAVGRNFKSLSPFPGSPFASRSPSTQDTQKHLPVSVVWYAAGTIQKERQDQQQCANHCVKQQKLLPSLAQDLLHQKSLFQEAIC